MDHVDKSVRLLKEAVEEFDRGAFATSSFQTQGVPLLHLISEHAPYLTIWFIDTGFHFAETLHYRDKLQDFLGLNIRLLPRTNAERIEETRAELWATDSDACCKALKVDVLEGLLSMYEHTCWISGVRRMQTAARSQMGEREAAPHGITRVHPMIGWSRLMIEEYMEEHGLPRHPLADKGYESIGCWPCTVPGQNRRGRWPGQQKEGCGIHGLIERTLCEE
ncbi:MAG: phosphoadenylyl-sulfate reductase [Dehalococcoidia bacterium]